MSQGNDGRFCEAAKAAALSTDERMSESEQVDATSSWDWLRGILTDSEDQAKIDRLMDILKQDTRHDEKVALMLANSEEIADIAVKISSKIAMKGIQ